MQYFKSVRSLFLIISLSAILTACGGGGSGSNAAGIAANIAGSHLFTLTYVVPVDPTTSSNSGDNITVTATAFVNQDPSTNALSGNVSFSQDPNASETCFQNGTIEPSSSVNGSTFTIDIAVSGGDSLNITGSITGNALSGTFVSADNNGLPCTARSGDFSSQF